MKKGFGVVRIMVVCLRLLAIYLLMGVCATIGLATFSWLNPMTAGAMDFGALSKCLDACLWLPFIAVLIGPIMVAGSMLAPGSGFFGLFVLMLVSALLYPLLFFAFRRLLRQWSWGWGLGLVIYSALVGYIFPIVMTTT